MVTNLQRVERGIIGSWSSNQLPASEILQVSESKPGWNEQDGTSRMDRAGWNEQDGSPD